MENSPGMKESCALSEVRIILIGGRWSGKSSSGNTILRRERFECGRTRTAQSELRHEEVEGRELTVVDAPGWSSSLSLTEIPEGDKQAFKLNVSKCPPGPHAFLLVTALDSAFSMEERRPLEHHMKLLGERVWRHTMVLFTCGDYLGKKTIEQHIENEGEALKWLVNKCGNRYHVFNNKDKGDSSQVMLLLEKIDEMVWHNNGGYYCLDERIFHIIQEKQREAAERADKRRKRAEEQRQQMKPIILGSRNKLQELKLLILGQKTVGKSATGNILLRKEIFATCANERCQEGKGEVDGRQVTVIDTPGWWKNSSQCTEDMDQEIVRGLSLCPSGAHAVLLVVPLDVRFTDSQWRAVEEHMSLFDATVWKHTLVVFTYGDMLADKSIEEHIENERYPLQWLVDKCENKYHVLNNTKKKDTSQITELFEKIEEMVAENSGRLFCPDMSDIHRRVEEKFRRREIKQVLKQRLEQEYRRRELELLTGFKQTLISLQTEMKQKSLMGDKTKIKAISIGQRKKDEKEKEEKIATKISQEIEKLDKEILKSTTFLRNSIDFLIPTMSEDPQTTSVAGSSLDSQNPSSNLDKVLGWLSTLQIGRNVENQLTLSFSETSGYRSLLADHFALNRDDDELE
ncbi:GTPase IMAP family member 8-like isoform X3 [Myripristis murdjan]|uniref:GTPase IMAP family member 8-like isoform X3 n=1 Tax=Myripristis murdjan TaxID=586833 RepID=UPI0011762CC7|nr:GTPase IMAP family member 8-like isoform X3 [Myripristis murdjan]